MTNTIYTFHRASDHAILATAAPHNLMDVAENVAASISGGKGETRRAYVHNGRGIVCAAICRDGAWIDTLRENYEPFEPKAREVRETAGYPND